MERWQSGAWAGLIATGPMTMTLLSLQKKLPPSEKSPLPPATISTQITEPLIKPLRNLSSDRRADLTLLMHFGYGLACGLAYALAGKKESVFPLLKGSAFGLSVWAASYMGWIPVVGFRASAFKMPARRNALMIAAHLIWGASLGLVEKELRQYGNQSLDGHRKALRAE